MVETEPQFQQQERHYSISSLATNDSRSGRLQDNISAVGKFTCKLVSSLPPAEVIQGSPLIHVTNLDGQNEHHTVLNLRNTTFITDQLGIRRSENCNSGNRYRPSLLDLFIHGHAHFDSIQCKFTDTLRSIVVEDDTFNSMRAARVR